MQPITWLHISDFHLQNNQAWSQDVVLKAMCDDISQRRSRNEKIDFILVTGDIAYSGKEGEYKLACSFFDELSRFSGVPLEKIFCVPGNHDVDRSRHTTCFIGARSILQTQSHIDAFLENNEELSTLLLRQKHYRDFTEKHFSQQERIWTPDKLAYVSILTIENLRIAIIALNTAWLAEGGMSDHGKIIAGERQVIEALKISSATKPHITIAMGHHPFHLFNEFDRRSVQQKIEENCHFFHSGHLHHPEIREVISHNGNSCVSVHAGASYETRHSHNSFAVLNLDIMAGVRTAKTITYDPIRTSFSDGPDARSPFLLKTATMCSLPELGNTIEYRFPDLKGLAFYMAALLVDAQKEVPIKIDNGYTFCSVEFMKEFASDAFKETTLAFLTLQNPLRLLHEKMLLAELVNQYEKIIYDFGVNLKKISDANEDFLIKITEREANARAISSAGTQPPFSHTIDLLDRLAREKDWVQLELTSERLLDSTVDEVRVAAHRRYALALAHSEEDIQKRQGSEVLEKLIESRQASSEDIAVQTVLLMELNEYSRAEKNLFIGIERFEKDLNGFINIGQKLVSLTGNRLLRDKLNALKVGGKIL